MEDGVKEETAEKPKCPSVAGKAGWIKKSSGGLLSLWKERYIQLCKAQLLVYEDEDEQKCVETVELERYDRCQELRALLKRKNRFILIRSPGCKVQDIKFQASSGEEKESWMKALNDGINRGKNRIFDEVKVDQTLSLEHVTRSRAKVAQSRRPPTRSHLKEVASAASDGILRLDMDVPDSGPPSAILETSETDSIPLPKETPKPPMPPAKPPMPPSEKPSADSVPEEAGVKRPPMPPAKPLKETAEPGGSTSPAEEAVAGAGSKTEEPEVAPDSEDVTEADKTPPQAPLPPPKILSDKMKVMWDNPASEPQAVEAVNPAADSSAENLSEVVKEILKPPTPPPKILSNQLRASLNLTQSSSEANASKDSCQNDDLDPPVNGVAGDECSEPVFQDKEESKGPSPEQGEDKERLGLPLTDQLLSSKPEGNSVAPTSRSASLGDLLLGPSKKPLLRPPLQQVGVFQVAQMERKVASEQERTEKLLQTVLQEGVEQAQAGSNGPPVSAETLLTEAAKQLQQATHVLQEIKSLGELKKEPVEWRKGTQKDLVTLYRRSAP